MLFNTEFQLPENEIGRYRVAESRQYIFYYIVVCREHERICRRCQTEFTRRRQEATVYLILSASN